MKYLKRHIVVVRAKESGYQPEFPLNMLRSDELWPYGVRDCCKIQRTISTGSVHVGDITLEGKHASQWVPKKNFWEDTGWTVVKHTFK